MSATALAPSLRIAQLHWGFPPIIGGVETHLTILLPEMVKLGHQVWLLTGAVEGAPALDTYKGVAVLREPIMDLNWLQKRGIEGLDAEVEKVFTGFLDAAQPDVVHAHNMHYFSKIHAEVLDRLARARDVPLVLTAHNVWDDNLFIDLARGIGWDQIIAVSHFIKKELIGVGIDDHLVTVVHHGIDEALFAPKGPVDQVLGQYPQLRERRVVFHPARMGLAKGCDISIKAINLLRERVPNVLLVLAGTKNIIDWVMTQQKEIAYMVNLVDFFGLRDHVLIDAFPLELMPELYRVSEVCFYPSTVSEPFGLTMLEALASARPMIVTEMGGMPEIIKDGINGYVIPVRDFEALAWRAVDLLQNDRVRERLGYTGRQMVEQHYTSHRVTTETLAVYEQIRRRARRRVSGRNAEVPGPVDAGRVTRGRLETKVSS